MEQAPALPQLYAAIHKVQGEIKRAEKNAKNPHLKSKYADLGATWEACRDALANHGVSVIQLPDMLDGEQALTTILAHEEGEAIQATIKLTPDRQGGPQGLGSGLTYFRRYALQSALGICPEDDDAASSQKRHNESKPEPSRGPKLASDVLKRGMWAQVSQRIADKDLGHRAVHFAHWRKHRTNLEFDQITTKDMTEQECQAVIRSFVEEANFEALMNALAEWEAQQG